MTTVTSDALRKIAKLLRHTLRMTGWTAEKGEVQVAQISTSGLPWEEYEASREMHFFIEQIVLSSATVAALDEENLTWPFHINAHRMNQAAKVRPAHTDTPQAYETYSTSSSPHA